MKTQAIQYLGYKSPVSLNEETGLITTVVPTGGNVTDNTQFPKRSAHDEVLGVKADIYNGDRA
jgi:hypothetical protein